MHAELKSIITTDGTIPDLDLRAFAPQHPANVSVVIDAYIGAAGHEGEEVFSFEVCTPQWLVDHPPEKGFRLARLLLVSRWDYAVVERALTDLCRNTRGRDWHTIGAKLSRYSRWEFEEYDG